MDESVEARGTRRGDGTSARELPTGRGRLVRAVEGTRNVPVAEIFPLGERGAILARSPVIEGDEAHATRGLLFLYHLARALDEAHSLKELLETVVDVALQAVGASRGFLALLDDDAGDEDPTDRLVPVVERDPVASLYDRRFNFSTTLVRRSLRERAAILTDDAGDDPFLSGSESVALLDIRSALCVPLWDEGRVLGVLYLDSVHESHHYGDAHLELLTAIGLQAGRSVSRHRATEELREWQEKRRALLRVHPREVVDHIAADVGSSPANPLAPVERPAVLLFAALSGFAAVTEDLPPETVAEVLEGFYSAATRVVFKHHGSVDKLLSGAVSAFFGPPYPQRDDAERAAAAALEMVDEVARLGRGRTGWPALALQVGMEAGLVMAGELGSGVRREYTVLGDAVNVAAALSEEATPGRVLMGPAVAARLGGRFGIEATACRSLRGRRAPTQAFWLPVQTPAAAGG
jgi:adenylate cyclase